MSFGTSFAFVVALIPAGNFSAWSQEVFLAEVLDGLFQRLGLPERLHDDVGRVGDQGGPSSKVGPAGNLPHDFARNDEAPKALGDDEVIYKATFLAGGARELSIRGSDNLQAQSLQDTGGLESVGGDVPAPCSDHHPSALVGRVGNAPEDVDVETTDAPPTLAIGRSP